MTPDENRNRLRDAESTARRFLEDHGAQIAETMGAKAEVLGALIHKLSLKETSFEDRLESLARISEVAQLLKQDADRFFQPASQPIVARILSDVPKE